MSRVVVTHSDSHPVDVGRVRAALADDHEVVAVELPGGRMAVDPTDDLVAALDVRAEEPPGEDDPLAAHDRTFVTPHVAGPTGGYLRRAAERGAAKVAAVLAGERPDYVVDPATLGVDGR